MTEAPGLFSGSFSRFERKYMKKLKQLDYVNLLIPEEPEKKAEAVPLPRGNHGVLGRSACREKC